MKMIIEILGESLTELIGGAVVLLSLASVISLFKTYGDLFISQFL